MSVAIVTDSTSDLDPAVAAAAGIDVVPLFVNFGDDRYRDVLEISRAEFYARMATDKALPTTSQPTSVMFEDVFRPHVEAGRDVVCITIDGKLSGTINAATAAAQQFPGAGIRVVDSLTVTAGLGLIALAAADRARAGATRDAVVAGVERDRERGIGYATVPDLQQAVRTGRVTRAQAFIGSLVKILPVLRIGRGEIGEEARVRTQTRAQEATIDAGARVANEADGARIAVIHSAAPHLAELFEAKLRTKLTATPASITRWEVGPVIGTHAGAGAAGIFVLPDTGSTS